MKELLEIVSLFLIPYGILSSSLKSFIVQSLASLTHPFLTFPSFAESLSPKSCECGGFLGISVNLQGK